MMTALHEVSIHAGHESTAKPRTAKKAIEPTKEELAELEEFDEGWEEDEDGNFVKKGDK